MGYPPHFLRKVLVAVEGGAPLETALGCAPFRFRDALREDAQAALEASRPSPPPTLDQRVEAIEAMLLEQALGG